ncbi:MAG TPA: hypothetical protein VG796_00350 [Verrucomicrobiales bacterium]|nr:hypothetical protein [Verrucomicrobiales bacterium]
MGASRTGILLSVLPNIVMLALFYSLALHMYQALGGWPSSIGERGFPFALKVHSAVATRFSHFLMICFLALPVPMLTCVFVKRWRHCVAYMTVYALVFLLCGLLMQKASPDPFLVWWVD